MSVYIYLYVSNRRVMCVVEPKLGKQPLRVLGWRLNAWLAAGAALLLGCVLRLWDPQGWRGSTGWEMDCGWAHFGGPWSHCCTTKSWVTCWQRGWRRKIFKYCWLKKQSGLWGCRGCTRSSLHLTGKRKDLHICCALGKEVRRGWSCFLPNTEPSFGAAAAQGHLRAQLLCYLRCCHSGTWQKSEPLTVTCPSGSVPCSLNNLLRKD